MPIFAVMHRDAIRRSRSAAGFTLVEVLVALVVCGIAAASLAALATTAMRAAWFARQQSLMAILALQKIEQLRALDLTFDPWAPGVPVTDLATDLAREPETAGGAGLQPSAPDTLDRNAPGYVDYLDSIGRWVGTGAGPPPGAVFARRWNVQAVVGDPDTLVLRVRVAMVVADAAHGLAAWRASGRSSVGLSALRTRK
jgi:prepilin-type N-terminal cleavage/methylation domain-containing protein